MINAKHVIANSSLEYKLSYKIKPHDGKNYTLGCIHEFLHMTMVVSGYTETNCFLSYTIFHLTGGSAILTYRVKDVLNDFDGSR
ncbi:odorant receptor 13a-like [Vespula maculifrons]|uniref:Odorant receptor 13a-like n=1 Tax=Vespula maculifrons TaxID=7453 RepID=A0ABD2BPD6_VESMC